MPLEPVSDILWRERRLIDALQRSVAAPRAKRFGDGDDDVSTIVSELRWAEIDRAVAVLDVAEELGLPSPPTLRALAAAAPAPWDYIFDEHRDALRDGVAATGDLVPQSLRESVG